MGKRRVQIGDIRRWTTTDQWFVVEKIDPRGGPTGRCFHGGNVGRNFHLGSQWMARIAEAKVPDHIWAALAEWRMTS